MARSARHSCTASGELSGGSITAGAAIDAAPYTGNASQYYLTFPG
jgi:hypothetical protein